MADLSIRNGLNLVSGDDEGPDWYTRLHDDFETIDAAIALCDDALAADPVAGDDELDGFSTRSIVITVAGKIFLCTDPTTANAVWRQLWPVTDTGGDVDFGAHEVRALTFESDVATGTAPLTIASTTVCTNLNADKVDGKDSTDLVLRDGSQALTAAWDAGPYEIRAETLESDVATGTAPLTVASETMVENLNADLLDGVEASALVAKSVLTEQGEIIYASGVATPAALAHGADTTRFLRTGGHAANPSWEVPDHGSIGGLSDADHVAASIALTATSRVLGRKTAGAGAGEECSLSDVLDFVGSAARGDLLVRGASAWARFAKGLTGQIIKQGADDPAWSWAEQIIAGFPAHYERSRMWKHKGSDSAANRRTLVTPDYMTVNINNLGYILSSALELDLNDTATWDSVATDYRVAATRAGKQFYVYACVPVSGIVPVILCSVASTYPSGYSATTSRKIGSFHCLCVAAGTITSHPLTGYLAGDILPRSIQDLKHRPRPGFVAGMVWAGVTDYLSDSYANVWAAIYLASGTGASTASVYGGTISDTRDWLDFTDDMHAVGCRLPTDHEFQGIAFGSNEETNITGSADPVTTGGHVDTAARRMISYIGCEDCCGAMWQWLDEQSFKSDYVTGWGYYDLPGAKGSLYNQDGATGRADVKLLAGSDWVSGSYCGSRCRNANSYRWEAHSNVAARAVVEPA